MFKNLRPLFPYLKKYRLGYFYGAMSVVLNNCIWVLMPQVLRRTFNDLNVTITNPDITRGKLFHYSLMIIGVAAGRGIFMFISRWVLIGISRDIEYDLRNDLFRHLEKLSHSWFLRARTGDIMARATNDLNAVRMLLGPAILYSANTLVYSAASLFFMARIS